jgi:hypothetical protein
MEPSAVELRESARELRGKKTKAQEIAHPLLGSKDPHVVRRPRKHSSRVIGGSRRR